MGRLLAFALTALFLASGQAQAYTATQRTPGESTVPLDPNLIDQKMEDPHPHQHNPKPFSPDKPHRKE